MANDSTSMSTLGSFYDALYELAEKQKKKHGEGAVPDLVPGQVTDAVAQGIIGVAGSLTGMDTGNASIATFGIDKVVNTITQGLGAKVGYTISPTGIKSSVSTGFNDVKTAHSFNPLEDDLVGITVGADNVAYKTGTAGEIEVKGPDIVFSPNNISAAMIDPVKFANKLADDYWANSKLAQQAEFIEQMGEGPNVRIAADYIVNRASGVDGDIASAISVAQNQSWRDNDMISKRTANISGFIEPEAFNETFDIDPKSVRDRNEVIATSMAAYSGIFDERERVDYAKYFNEKLKDDILLEYNNMATAAGKDRVLTFDEIFSSAKATSTTASLFNATHDGPGDLAQKAYRQAILVGLTGTSVPAHVRAGLSNLDLKVQNNNAFTDVLHDMFTATKKADTRAIITRGTQQLYNDSLTTPLTPRERRKANALFPASNRVNAEGRDTTQFQKSASAAGYLYYRWNRMPTLNKIFTPVGLFTGQSWLQLSDLTGGLGKNMPRMTHLGWSDGKGNNTLGIPALYDVNRDKKIKKFQTQSAAFMSQAITAKNNSLMATNISDKNKWLEKSKKFESKSAERAFRAGDRQKFLHNNFNWKPIFVVSHKANIAQKFSYRMYSLSPGQFVGGLLNGDTAQRMLWIGTKFGKKMWTYNTVTDPTSGAVLSRTKALNMGEWSRGARFAHRLLNNKAYRALAGFTRIVNFTVNAPAILAQEMLKRMRKAAQDAGHAMAVWIQKKILGKTLSGVLAVMTAGVTKALEVGYFILNALSLGLLDKISQAVFRFTMQLVVGLIIGIIVIIIAGAQAITGGVGGPAYIAQNSGNGGLLPPDPNFSPVLATDTSGGAGKPPSDYPFPPECADFSGLTCPFTFTSRVYCSQGPFGGGPTGTHACAPDITGEASQLRYAVDISGVTGLRAPEPGNIVFVEPDEMCDGEPNGAYLIFQGSLTGTRYRFAHLLLGGKSKGLSGNVSVAVAQGENMGSSAPLTPFCSAKNGCKCWHHQHIHAFIEGSKAPDVIFGKMCGGKVLSCTNNCTPDCKTCGTKVVPQMPNACDPNDGSGTGGTGGGTCKGYTSGVAGSYTPDELATGNIGAGTCNTSLPDSQFSIPGVDKEKFISIAESSRIWQIAEEVPKGSGKTPNLARECFNYVVCKARKSGINPSFALSLWMHESAASNYTFFGIGKRDEDMGIHCYKGSTAGEVCACGTTAANNLKAQVEMFNSLTHYDCGRGMEGWASQYGKGTCYSTYGIGYVKEMKLEWSWFASASSFPTWTKDVTKAEPGLNCDAAWVPRP